MGQAQENDDEQNDSDNEQKQLSLQMSNALRTVNDLWQRNSIPWTVDRENMVTSKIDVSQMKKSGFQRRREQSRKEPESEQCAAYISLTKTNATTWWRKSGTAKHNRHKNKLSFWSMLLRDATQNERSYRNGTRQKARQEARCCQNPVVVRY